jgi:hypothetical protein
MKRTILCVTLVVIAIMAKAQGNLQFNQVIRLSYTGFIASNAAPVSAGSITVPANKVWKIESGSAIDTKLYTVPFSLTVDGQLIYSGHSSGSSMPFYASPPIWLSAGTYNVSVALVTGFNYNFVAKISALEFNITP